MSANHKDETKKNSTNLKTNQLHRMDDKQLRDLLDEAYSYKKYSDRDSKSKIFKELLDKAELEDKERVSTYNEIFTRKSQKKYSSGGSLQNINDALRFEYFDQNFKRSGYSKSKKSQVSVTTKEYGGGSLPCNFNNMLYSEKYDDLRTRDTSKPIKQNTNIEEKKLHDLKQEDSDPTFNCLVSQITKNEDQLVNRRSSFYISSADSVIDIPLLEIKNEVDDHRPLQLCSAYSSVKCIIDDKGATQPFAIGMSHVPKVSNTNSFGTLNSTINQQSKHFDENGNAVSSTNPNKTKTKMKMSKSDRNIKRTFRSTDIEGYRGGEEVETLVNYIENENQEKSKSKKNKPNISDEKIKKKINKKNKVKRYNSLEELRSTKDFANDSTQINTEKSCSSKNLDRYSWGKAEISFLQSTTNPNSDISNTKTDIWSTCSMESLPTNDCSGFNLVTNKKKSRKKMQLCMYEKETKIQCSENNKCTNQSKAKYQLNKKNIASEKKIDKFLKARRKSFSSVPQSDISDCSDVESVHSLPDSYTKHSTSAESYLSYAEIIRKSSKTQNSDWQNNSNIETVTKTSSEKRRYNEKRSETNRQNVKSDDMKELVKSNSLDNDIHKVHKITQSFQDNKKITKNDYEDNYNRICEDFKKKRKTKEFNAVNQPAVIMKDCNAVSDNELVFGFDINKDLLCDDDGDSSIKYTENKTTLGFDSRNRSFNEVIKTDNSQKEKNILEKQNLLKYPTNRNNSDLEHIVHFVSSAWEEIILGFNGKVEYYNAAFHLSA